MSIFDNTWHKPDMEYEFQNYSNKYRIITNCNVISAIWINGTLVQGDAIIREEKGNEIFSGSKIYAVWNIVGPKEYRWNDKELARIRKLQEKKKRS